MDFYTDFMKHAKGQDYNQLFYHKHFCFFRDVLSLKCALHLTKCIYYSKLFEV